MCHEELKDSLHGNFRRITAKLGNVFLYPSKSFTLCKHNVKIPETDGEKNAYGLANQDCRHQHLWLPVKPKIQILENESNQQQIFRVRAEPTIKYLWAYIKTTEKMRSNNWSDTNL